MEKKDGKKNAWAQIGRKREEPRREKWATEFLTVRNVIKFNL